MLINILRLLGLILIAGGIFGYFEFSNIKTSYLAIKLLSTDFSVTLEQLKRTTSLFILISGLINGLVVLLIGEIFKRQAMLK